MASSLAAFRRLGGSFALPLTCETRKKTISYLHNIISNALSCKRKLHFPSSVFGNGKRLRGWLGRVSPTCGSGVKDMLESANEVFWGGKSAEEGDFLDAEVCLREIQFCVSDTFLAKEGFEGLFAGVLYNGAGARDGKGEVTRQVPGLKRAVVIVGDEGVNTGCRGICRERLLPQIVFQGVQDAFRKNREHSGNAADFLRIVKSAP